MFIFPEELRKHLASHDYSFFMKRKSTGIEWLDKGPLSFAFGNIRTEKIEDIILQDPTLTEYILNPTWVYSTNARNLGLWMYARAHQIGLDRMIKQVESFFNNKDILISHTSIISGVKIDKKIQICDNLFLTPAVHATPSVWLHSLTTQPVPLLEPKSSPDLSISIHETLTYKELQKLPQHKFRFSLKAISNLIALGANSPSMKHADWINVLTDMPGVGIHSSGSSSEGNDVILKEIKRTGTLEIHSTIELLEYWMNVPDQLQTRLNLTMENWNRSKRRVKLNDRIVDASIALESLVHDNSGEKATAKCKHGPALILGSIGIEKDLCTKSFNDFYKFRSQLVHTGQLTHTRKAHKLMERIMDYLRMMILISIKKGHIPPILEYLERKAHLKS